MCKEVDEEDTTTKSADPKKSHDPNADASEKDNMQIGLPDPKPPMAPPKEIIPLPIHTTGLPADPLKISAQEQLQDIELSEMSKK